MFSGDEQPVSFSWLGFGNIVPETTVYKMINIIKSSAKNYELREFAANTTQHAPAKDQWAEAEEIYHFVQNHSRYLKDPHGTEMIQSPLIFIDKVKKGQMWYGDCDDFTVLLLSLYRSIGYPTAIRTAAYGKNKKPGHVYGLIKLYGTWFPIDGIKKDGFVGWEAPNATAIKDYEIKNSVLGGL